mmetsp:Transcript_114473/g.370016  ORF Transcript_114473/g.370016 Transcript_114473/m.370016 type:complete len:411 (-) Transcript_114473:287-1519(-)
MSPHCNRVQPQMPADPQPPEVSRRNTPTTRLAPRLRAWRPPSSPNGHCREIHGRGEARVVVERQHEPPLAGPFAELARGGSRQGVDEDGGEQGVGVWEGAEEVLDGDGCPDCRRGTTQHPQHLAVETKEVMPGIHRLPEKIRQATGRRLVEQFDGDDVGMSLPDAAEVQDERHIRIEQVLSVRSVEVRIVEPVCDVLDLHREEKRALAPRVVVVVEPDARVAQVHQLRVPVVGAHREGAPRVLVVRPIFVSHRLHTWDWHAELLQQPGCRLGHEQFHGVLRRDNVGLTLGGRLLHMGGHPPRQALPSVGRAECILVDVQEDVDAFSGEGRHDRLQSVGPLLVDVACPIRHRGLEQHAQPDHRQHPPWRAVRGGRGGECHVAGALGHGLGVAAHDVQRREVWRGLHDVVAA